MARYSMGKADKLDPYIVGVITIGGPERWDVRQLGDTIQSFEGPGSYEKARSLALKLGSVLEPKPARRIGQRLRRAA